jgi:hypothetical protein
MKRTISSQVRADIKAAKKIWLPWRVLLPLMVACIPVFMLFDHYGKLNMALPVLNCAGVFGLLIYLKWALRRQPLFWATVAVLVAVHILLIWYIPWTSKWVPAVAIAGISSIDFCLMLLALAAVETLLASQSTAES